ncbi:helix-turn-helix domain-containing protein [Actinoplanes sp. N902-109]|uniref:helix-turn-helix domain-containing protein n=1 Tax=Actinoplanes sp. (strain N902-109) TaxID=649831 RepID=UPI00032956DE|nr:helix-turn-helix transcriptional regulator [Actinoplanes sp. N902-109]AGL20706.1 DNA-binding protein [Actinoplanes sp. N902-109]
MDNALGEFLRARRELTRPERVGLPPAAGRRRVPGLRREEVAMLAGVSSDYYVRLEQGRDRHPSDQVLEALSRVLDLGPDGLEHARRLAGATPAPRRPKSRGTVVPGLRRLLDAMSDCPCLVVDRHLDVLAANVLARALNPAFAPGHNLVRAMFLDPGARDLYVEWDRHAQETVASLRASAGTDPDDPRLSEIVGELSVKSPEFRRWWARHEVKVKTRGTKHLLHPQVGPLTVDYETLAPQGAGDQLLFAYHAEPGSPSAAALTLLGSVAVSA